MTGDDFSIMVAFLRGRRYQKLTLRWFWQAAEHEMQAALASSMRESGKTHLIAQLMAMGVPRFKAEYAAEHAEDIETAMAFLEPPKEGASPEEQQLMGMCDVSLEQARYALEVAQGNADMAVNLLLNQGF